MASDVRLLQRLRDDGVLRMAAPGRYWIDMPAWNVLRRRRQRTAWFVLVGLAAGLLLVALGSTLLR